MCVYIIYIYVYVYIYIYTYIYITHITPSLSLSHTHTHEEDMRTLFLVLSFSLCLPFNIKAWPTRVLLEVVHCVPTACPVRGLHQQSISLKQVATKRAKTLKHRNLKSQTFRPSISCDISRGVEKSGKQTDVPERVRSFFYKQ